MAQILNRFVKFNLCDLAIYSNKHQMRLPFCGKYNKKTNRMDEQNIHKIL